ncbi:MAG: CHASE domain-containing protein [Tepidamorphaceae bacterium]
MLLEPTDTRNVAALAFDMFSEETRRIAMKQALQSDEPVASAPVELVQEITSDKQAGFLVYLRYGSATEVEQVMKGNIAMSGFVYAPFRAGDLHTAALSRKPLLPIVLETYDISGGTECRSTAAPVTMNCAASKEINWSR